MLRELGFTPGSIIKPGTVTLSRTAEVRRYYERDVGTHNPHDWRRYQAAIKKIGYQGDSDASETTTG